ncbi:Conserved_hypothetical protein [Hexamita inflata]|uniref:Uncharacterized protein n=1 Tax=Hexamita inflata TaxID=28002 RepID=A0AA86TF49_9EUKA|nr:Conserved hypothetical protein [Hexamita inflata]
MNSKFAQTPNIERFMQKFKCSMDQATLCLDLSKNNFETAVQIFIKSNPKVLEQTKQIKTQYISAQQLSKPKSKTTKDKFDEIMQSLSGINNRFTVLENRFTVLENRFTVLENRFTVLEESSHFSYWDQAKTKYIKEQLSSITSTKGTQQYKSDIENVINDMITRFGYSKTVCEHKVNLINKELNIIV